MKFYIDNFSYFTDLITEDVGFKLNQDQTLEINGILSPLNFLCYLFLENDNKLKDKDSKIFIDTPKKFWLYEFSSIFSKKIYKKIR